MDLKSRWTHHGIPHRGVDGMGRRKAKVFKIGIYLIAFFSIIE
jgi:hypothetical protein